LSESKIKPDRMMVSIYKVLFFSNPQVLQDLDRFQMELYQCHIQRVPEKHLEITVQGEIEPLEEIAEIMRQPRSRD